ncbi:hypothetical protein BJ878DRAFT_136095 [Calycina marina]|uniref:DUF7082 domain-containing protein n=1 Tax=Calycina marina TaxID=1763456 RepID=A0A9P7Z1B4_9HELO|nr:hypothetical protein BJ878DRAFT_136095 [Calycina marina]
MNTAKLAYSAYSLFDPGHFFSEKPIIIDEHYESPETVALHEEGYEGALVARAGSPTDLISMAAYGKPHPQPNLQGFDHGRSYVDNGFAFNTPVYGTQTSASIPTLSPNYQSTTQLTHMAYNANQSRSTFDDQSGPYLHVGSTPEPQVTSWSPQRGNGGDGFSVYIASLYDLSPSSSPSFYVKFGQAKCEALLTKMGQQGANCTYVVTTDIPQFTMTRWSSIEVPVQMLMETGDGDIIAKKDVGTFTFTDGSSELQQPLHEISRKRKMSTDSTELMQSPVKRSSSQMLRPKEEYSAYNYISTDSTSPYSPYLQTANNSYGQNMMQHRYSQHPSSYQGQAPPRNLPYSYSNSTAASSPKIKVQSPQFTDWSNTYQNSGATVAQTPVTSGGVTLSRSGLPSSDVCVNLSLVRTTTMQNPSTAPTQSAAQFNSYSLYPHKAKLEIHGDLDSVAHGWSDAEIESKRRLVHFRRSQSGCTITATFQPVSPEDWQQDSICISCIHWEERRECFVTSVDTIYLLEQLVAARFTVEEKNRIRRNLEGFRPLTVSKGKPESEEFFKVIMAFPNPKPRNIEKDVKAFHWKDLASALKKIIGKYSASPASTIPSGLSTPVSSTAYSTENSLIGVSYLDHHAAVSPRPLAGSATSTAYVGNMPARVVSPLTQKPIAISGSTSKVQMASQQGHPHDTSGQRWLVNGNQNSHRMAVAQQYPQGQLGSSQMQSSRASWDIPPYLDNNTAAAARSSGNGSTMDYRSRNASAVTKDAPTAADGEVDVNGKNVRSMSLQQSHQMQQT